MATGEKRTAINGTGACGRRGSDPTLVMHTARVGGERGIGDDAKYSKSSRVISCPAAPGVLGCEVGGGGSYDKFFCPRHWSSPPWCPWIVHPDQGPGSADAVPRSRSAPLSASLAGISNPCYIPLTGAPPRITPRSVPPDSHGAVPNIWYGKLMYFGGSPGAPGGASARRRSRLTFVSDPVSV